MFTANQFRAKAAECTELLRNTIIPSEIREHRRSRESFSLLAQNQDWLADNSDKIVRSQDVASQRQSPQPGAAENRVDRATVDSKAIATVDEYSLRRLGAAVIMRWNDIPTKLQRELFATAGSPADALQSAALRGQIARFLHRHKDHGNPGASPASVTEG